MATINKKGIAQIKSSDAEASAYDNMPQDKAVVEAPQDEVSLIAEQAVDAVDVLSPEGISGEDKSEEAAGVDKPADAEAAPEGTVGSEPPPANQEAPALESASITEASVKDPVPVLKPIPDHAPEDPAYQQAEVDQPKQEPEVPQQSTVFKSPHQGHAQAPVLDYLDRVRDSGSVIQKRALAAIEKLNNAIRPKVMISNKEFIAEQREFFRAMLWALELPYEDFSAAWNIYQKFFQAHHDVNGVFGNNSPRQYTSLSEYRLYQTPAKEWGNRLEEYEVFKILTAHLRTLRNPESRQVEKKTIEFDRIVDGRFIKEAGCNNLKQFYDV